MGRKGKYGKWKPVQLTENLISKGLDGLVGIEELTDYKIVKGDESQNIQKETSGKSIAFTTDGDFQVTSAKRKKELRQSSSKRRKLKHKRKRQEKNVIDRSSEVLKTDEDEAQSTSSEVEGKCEVSGFLDNMSAWSGLGIASSILKALAEQGFMEPTEIQAKTLPATVLGKRDVLGAAETGSGKTLAFGIPILHRILQDKEWSKGDTKKADDAESYQDEIESEECVNSEPEDIGCAQVVSDVSLHNTMGYPESKLYALVLTPTRELAMQVHRHLTYAAKYTGIKIQNESETPEGEDMDQSENNLRNSSENVISYGEELLASCRNPRLEDNSLLALSDCLFSIFTAVLHIWRPFFNVQPENTLFCDSKDPLFTEIAVVVGGMAPQKQERLLSRRPEVVVATPGRLWELIQDGNPHLAEVSNIRYLAIDETDRMLEKGHFQELHNLLQLLNVDGNKARQRQNFVFSATLTMVHEPPGRLKSHSKKLRLTPGQKLQNIMTMLGITNPKVVDVTKETGTASTLTETRIICAFEEKDFYLYYFIQLHKGRTLIFCNSISCVRRLAQLLTLLQCRPLPFHANMMQRQRLKNLDRFRDDACGLLLATDVAARGLDIADVQHVIHYQVPRTSESYVHRSGRTARANKEGLTLLLIEPAEVPHYTRLCQTLGRTKDLPLFPISSNLLEVVKQRVSLARELDQLELTARRSNSETRWFQKALTDMDMLVDDIDLPQQLDHDESSRLRRLAAVKRRELGALLSKPFVNVMKSAVDIRVRPQNRNSVFLNRNCKIKRKSKE